VKLEPRYRKCKSCGRKHWTQIGGVCRKCAGDPPSATSRMSRHRRSLVAAKKLRARHGLTQDLMVPWFKLPQRPRHYKAAYWRRLMAKLEKHELVVWNYLLRELRRTFGRR